MDIVIVLIVCGIILYVVFGNQTEKKYKKGLTALQSNDLDLAEQLFKEILEKHTEAKSKLDEITFKRGELSEKKGQLEKAYEYFSAIQKNNSDAAKKLIEIDYTRGLAAKKDGDLNTAYNYFSKIATKSNKAFYEVSKIDFKRGVSSELSKDYSTAKDFYKKSSNYKDDTKVHFGSICRKLICDLKIDLLPAEQESSEIISSSVDVKLKNDFLYRYAVKLIKKNNLISASEFIAKKLDRSLPETENLESFILNYKKSQLRKTIEEINDLLFKSENKATSTEHLHKKIEEQKNIIEEFPQYSTAIFEIQKNLFGKLLHQYIYEQQFEKCLEHITSYPNFYDNIELLKDAGICCIRIALNGEITEINYKNVISIWLTAIYNDDIFINSLENTTWDDDYTFTIKNTVGKFGSFIYKREWANINREQPSETNIPIGDSQRELINLFENSLNEIQPESLHNKVYSFYVEEKKTISNLVELLGYDILHATPEFARNFKTSDSILKRANWRYETKENQELLMTGSKYLTLRFNDGGGVVYSSTDIFDKFACSKYYSDLAIERIKKNTQVSPEVYKDVLNWFDKIKYSFEDEVLGIFNSKIKINDSDTQLMTIMEQVFNIIPHSEKLGYLFANYTTNYCIDKINSKSITETKALELLVKAISICPDNHKTAKNLAIFVGMHLSDVDFNKKIKSLIPSLQKIESESLYDSFQNELLPLKNELNSLLRNPNINYSRVRDSINIIDELINSVEP